jgi:hypothetical protein
MRGRNPGPSRDRPGAVGRADRFRQRGGDLTQSRRSAEEKEERLGRGGEPGVMEENRWRSRSDDLGLSVSFSGVLSEFLQE